MKDVLVLEDTSSMVDFNKKVQAKFNEMIKTGKLFRSELTGQQIWDLYLSSFAKEDDPIFRDPASTSHNCNHCKNFIRRYGNIVSIDDNYNITTMFDVTPTGTNDEYANTMVALTAALKSAKVTEVFFETFDELNKLPYESCTKASKVFQLGVKSNPKRYTKEEAEKYGVVKPNEVRTFNHLHLSLDKQFVDQSGKSVEALMGEYRDAKNVFQRAMETISLDTLYLVRDLITQGSLLDGETHLYKVRDFINFKYAYDNTPINQRDNWCWVNSYKMPLAQQKLRFQTAKGLLTTEQLWDLSIDDLDTLVVSLDAEYASSGKKSFVEKKSVKDKTAKLRFDVALDILNTKLDEAQVLAEAKEKKEHNKKILELIAEKQDDSLKGKSIKQLEGMLK